MLDGYRVKLPESLQFAAQSGDYASRIEMTKNEKLVLDVWVYVTVVKV